MEDNNQPKEAGEAITDLYKYFLEVLEDIKKDHDLGIGRMRKSLVFTQNRIKKKHDLELIIEPIAIQANFFDKDYYNHLRKRILDKGNQEIRKTEQTK